MALVPTTVKRSQVKTFLNIGTAETPSWKLIGDGVTTAAVEMNPEVTEEQYIHQDSPSKFLEAYSPTMPIEAVAKAGDAVFDYIENLYFTRAILDEAKGEIVHVYLHKTETTGSWPAEKQPVVISVENYGGEKKLSINYTLNYDGDPVTGSFNPTTATFTADA
ncbi:MAG TPA: hypothetical protein VFF68_03040 [Anaerolineaceae bacterium]|nr:hypothetical protein [Anaerolineaceae bacterium]